uniref:Putative secreted protein n=1 Tax=Anopheles marajoara TaxID=58244 RepID=A0A2M4C8Z2_9DIPT
MNWRISIIFSLVSMTSGYSFISCETDFRCCIVGETMAVEIGPRVSDVMTAPISPIRRNTPPSESMWPVGRPVPSASLLDTQSRMLSSVFVSRNRSLKL